MGPTRRAKRDGPFAIKVIPLITPTFTPGVSGSLRTMLERLMSVSDIIEEMNLIFLREECGADAVHRRVSPSLERNKIKSSVCETIYARKKESNLVVKSAFLVEELKVFAIRLASPEPQVGDFEVAPDCR